MIIVIDEHIEVHVAYFAVVQQMQRVSQQQLLHMN
jgi:hypothetical protein